MNQEKAIIGFRTVGIFVLLIALIVFLSGISNTLWGGKPEALPEPTDFTIDEGMTLQDFGAANDLTNPMLKEIFGLQTNSELQNILSDYGTPEQIQSFATAKLALVAEEESKNWIKIAIKFVLWSAFLITVFLVFKQRKVTPVIRYSTLVSSVLIFGIIMGSDPSPMGTVKDAIYLYGAKGAIFSQRMIALVVFLLMVFIANKYICSWGCQAGVLQDLIFRMNQNSKRKSLLGKQVKIPFVITNTLRIIFFVVFTILAFGWSLEVIEPIDPFRIYNPAHLTLSAIIAVSAIYLISLFIYRPWCHFACPFGLTGWIVEKISLVRISVDYNTCIACQKCATACPSTVMNAILKQEEKTIPDCFSCYTCRDVCPSDSISYSTRKRVKAPSGFFSKKK